MTPTVLVAYASKNGATAEIATAVAAALSEHGVDTQLRPAAEVTGDLRRFDGVVLGSAVYMKRWRPEARRLLRRHVRELADVPFWVFSSGMVGEQTDLAWAEPPRVVRRVEELGAREHVVFGGRVPLEPRNFVERAMKRDTPPRFADRRDWDEIRAWGEGIAETLGGSARADARAGGAVAVP